MNKKIKVSVSSAMSLDLVEKLEGYLKKQDIYDTRSALIAGIVEQFFARTKYGLKQRDKISSKSKKGQKGE